ncbi:hypothetical protein T08_14381 [Trichinella sp. T8]|nr:hypothetical protein T08_14381 [Trichinella sp. T8]
MADDSDLRLVPNRRGDRNIGGARKYVVEKSFLNTCSSLSKNPRGNKALLLQLRGEKVSVLSYICHNSGGQLLKRRQSEMWLTARLFGLRLRCTVRGIAQPSRFSNYFSMIWVARRGVSYWKLFYNEPGGLYLSAGYGEDTNVAADELSQLRLKELVKRPGYGTVGKPIKLACNYFPLIKLQKGDIVVNRYHIDIQHPRLKLNWFDFNLLSIPSLIVPKKLQYYTTTKSQTKFFVEAFTTILSAKKLEKDDVIKISLSLFGLVTQVDLSNFYFELCREPEVVVLNKQQIEELRDDYMPPKLDEMSRLLNITFGLLTIGKKIDVQYCIEWMTARAKAIYSILDIPWDEKALDKVVTPERLKVLSDTFGRAQRMRCVICIFIIHMSKSTTCDQPIYEYIADMLKYGQLIGFYLIYYILVCDTAHPIMRDSYLTMDTIKFIEAYDVWNEYPECYREYMEQMADKDTLALMGGHCLQRLTYIAIQIGSRRDPSLKNLKFVIPPDSDKLDLLIKKYFPDETTG